MTPVSPSMTGAPSEAGSADSARWWAVEIELPMAATQPLLAVGAESKGAFCLVAGRRARLSRNFGTLTCPGNYRAYRAALAAAQREAGVAARLVARDVHPGYVSTGLAAGLGLPECVVQHHHAHIASCMAEHGCVEPVVGICCDGTGCGLDKASWGCEVLEVTTASFRRAAHLQYFGLPGGDAAARECWRSALGLVHGAFGDEPPPAVRGRFASVPADELRVGMRLLSRGVRCPQTSSLGRLFDAVAFLLGVGTENTHEAEAACRLEAAAGAESGRAMPVERLAASGAEAFVLGPVVGALCERRAGGESVARLAADFHATVAGMLVAAAADAAERMSVTKVALSGGSLANRRLRDGLAAGLRRVGLTVLEHRRAPCGDAGLALGQALVAVARDHAAGAGG